MTLATAAFPECSPPVAALAESDELTTQRAVVTFAHKFAAFSFLSKCSIFCNHTDYC